MRERDAPNARGSMHGKHQVGGEEKQKTRQKHQWKAYKENHKEERGHNDGQLSMRSTRIERGPLGGRARSLVPGEWGVVPLTPIHGGAVILALAVPIGLFS